MSITCGYFNSQNGDRKYNAETMSNYYEGLISKGVLANFGSSMAVTASGGMYVAVGTGKAYFTDGRWMVNDAPYTLTVDIADTTLPRIDRVVLRKDASNASRTCTIIIKTGTPAETPQPPELMLSESVEEMSLAQIYVSPLVTAITQDVITDERPNDVCGFVHGLIEQISTEELFAQYQATFENWFNQVVDQVATKTLVRQYYSQYVTVGNETEIPINISQYTPALDVLNVYVNGMRLAMDTEYTRDINDNTKITLAEPLGEGQVIDIQVLKSIDGSEAETVGQQVYELQEEVTAMKKYTYYTVGDDDNIKLSAFVQTLMQSAYAPGQITVEVVGHEFQVEAPISGAGVTSNRYKFFEFGYADSPDKRVIVDFAKCDRVLIQTAYNNILVFSGDNVDIRNLRLQVYGAQNVTVSDAKGAKFRNCAVLVNGSGTVQFACGHVDADDCEITVTSADGAAYCFAGSTGRGVTLQRIRGGRLLAYTSSSVSAVSSAVYQPSGENNIVIMDGCSCPLVTKSGYKQSNTVKLNSGKYALTSNILGAAASLYSQTAGTETGTIIASV